MQVPVIGLNVDELVYDYNMSCMGRANLRDHIVHVLTQGEVDTDDVPELIERITEAFQTHVE